MKEIVDLFGLILEQGEASHPDMLVVFFHEPPVRPAWSVAAVVRLEGWNDLSLEEKTITYIQPLSEFLEGVKAQNQATKYGFVNFEEAVGITDGTLQTEIADALRSGAVEARSFRNVFFLLDGQISVTEHPLPASQVSA